MTVPVQFTSLISELLKRRGDSSKRSPEHELLGNQWKTVWSRQCPASHWYTLQPFTVLELSYESFFRDTQTHIHTLHSVNEKK